MKTLTKVLIGAGVLGGGGLIAYLVSSKKNNSVPVNPSTATALTKQATAVVDYAPPAPTPPPPPVVDYAPPIKMPSDPIPPITKIVMDIPAKLPQVPIVSLPATPPVIEKKVTNGSVVKGSGSEVYYIIDGQKQYVPSADALYSLGKNFSDVITISDEDLNSIPNQMIEAKPEIKSKYPPNTVVKGSGAAVFVINNGVKKYVTSEAALHALNKNWGDIITISDQELNSIPGLGRMEEEQTLSLI